MAKEVAAQIHRCPHCGASDVSLDAGQGKLKCNYCKTVFDEKTANDVGGVDVLSGETVYEGAEDLIPSDNIIVTLKCPSCGAEMVVTAEEAMDVKCHWCRHNLNSGQKIKNGAVPDLVLPFKISRRDAIAKIEKYVRSDANVSPEFLTHFKPDDVKGVYFSYFDIDVKAHSTLSGRAEHSTSKRVSPPYDVELYDVAREFDIMVDDLTVEASTNMLNQDTAVNSNNVINAIMPFDTENAVAWSPEYLRGFSSQKRDVDRAQMKEMIALQCGDIARRKAKETAEQYDRGIRWQSEHLSVKGAKWKTAYLPVWLYSFRWPDNRTNRIFYVALNARTGEIVGHLPAKNDLSSAKRFFTPGKVILIGLAAWIGATIVAAILSYLDWNLLAIVVRFFRFWIFVATAVLAVISGSFKKGQAAGLDGVKPIQTRHYHEAETRAEIKNVKKTDKKLKSGRLYTTEVAGRNDMRAIGSASYGRNEMLNSELKRFANGKEYTNALQANYGLPKEATNHIRQAAKRSVSNHTSRAIESVIFKFFKTIIIAFVVIAIICILFSSGGSGVHYSGGGGSSYDSSWDSSDWDWGSSDSGWDWDSSDSDWDSGWDSDSGGFDYDWD